VIFDTDVLIWALRGNERAAAVIDGQAEREVSIVSHMELIQGARNKRELAAIRRFLLAFQTIPLSEEIGYRARLYMEQHGLRSSLELADALIAATAAGRQTILCTANVKHYRVISDLELKPFRHR
jgi:predicted nucleic acid-binding protein